MTWISEDEEATQKWLAFRYILKSSEFQALNLVVFENKIKKIALQKQLIYLLNEEVIWQASDSPLSKELYDLTLGAFAQQCRKPKMVKRVTIFANTSLGRGGGQVVRELSFYSDDLS